MTWLVMGLFHCIPQVTGWGSVNLNHLFTHHLRRIWLLLARRDKWIIDNRGMILNLIHALVGISIVFIMVFRCHQRYAILTQRGVAKTRDLLVHVWLAAVRHPTHYKKKLMNTIQF